MTKSQKENELFREKTAGKFGQIDASIRNLERQIGQLALAAHARAPGTLPSDTIPNPKGKEQCNAVRLRSGLELQPPKLPDTQSKPYTSHAEADKGEAHFGGVGMEGQSEKASGVPNMGSSRPKTPLSPALDPKSKFNFPDFIPPPPFPIKQKKKAKEKSFEWMMNVIRKVSVEVPLIDLFTNFPRFSQFFKDLLAKKGKTQEEGVMALSASCSQLIQGRWPIKMKDPGSCVIPCEIGDTIFPKCLLDQGSGISLMALKTARAIGLGERIEPIDIALQLADHSIVKPSGIVEDVLVKVDKFIIPVDFVILDMPEDKQVPILFGRPFLATGDVTLRTKDNNVTFKINGEEVAIIKEKGRMHPMDPPG